MLGVIAAGALVCGRMACGVCDVLVLGWGASGVGDSDATADRGMHEWVRPVASRVRHWS